MTNGSKEDDSVGDGIRVVSDTFSDDKDSDSSSHKESKMERKSRLMPRTLLNFPTVTNELESNKNADYSPISNA